jgi:hypothetical protein
MWRDDADATQRDVQPNIAFDESRGISTALRRDARLSDIVTNSSCLLWKRLLAVDPHDPHAWRFIVPRFSALLVRFWSGYQTSYALIHSRKSPLSQVGWLFRAETTLRLKEHAEADISVQRNASSHGYPLPQAASPPQVRFIVTSQANRPIALT